ncbi:MAG: hypothetical protein HFI31_08330 [Lachnospiraceae bacterium]|nr:hypothetical protein [Lachnospiraceae bacterium]MCI9134180.1 hypothetical protein [Lachnospiraceae bacterium]
MRGCKALRKAAVRISESFEGDISGQKMAGKFWKCAMGKMKRGASGRDKEGMFAEEEERKGWL